MSGAKRHVATAAAVITGIAGGFQLLQSCDMTMTEPALMAARPVPVEYIDSLAVRGTSDSVNAGTPVGFCSFPVFRNGAVGLVPSDSAVCYQMYVSKFTATQRTLNRKQRAVLQQDPATWP